jgi:hypothetical protein
MLRYVQENLMTSDGVNRRNFVMQTAVGGVVLLATSRGVFAQTTQPIPERPPALAAAMVQEFVRKAHADLPATKAMLAEQPALLNATWDWGGGDFEAAIGGAGHMGNREIAELLISQGARFDIFVAAMLGKLEMVRAAVTTWPDVVHSKGPHGIRLLRHARAGGEAASAVVEYLVSKGAA